MEDARFRTLRVLETLTLSIRATPERVMKLPSHWRCETLKKRCDETGYAIGRGHLEEDSIIVIHQEVMSRKENTNNMSANKTPDSKSPASPNAPSRALLHCLPTVAPDLVGDKIKLNRKVNDKASWE